MVNSLIRIKPVWRATKRHAGRFEPYPPRFSVSRAMTSFWISLAPS